MPSASEPGLPIVRFVGPSGSGKTTLLEKVVAALVAVGLRVAVVKDTHHQVELDQPGKDTWRLAQAGAQQVLLASDRQLTLFQQRPGRASLAEVAELVAPRADLLLAEGFRHSSEPAVLVWRADLGRPAPRLDGPLLAVAGDLPPDCPAAHFSLNDAAPIAELIRELVVGGRP
jgi:molybdopterin-guanine dinucleotide biosynthesis protein MobB